MKTITVKRTVEVEVEVEVDLELEDDDDGCGSPSQTGNSMTGCRGSHLAVQGLTARTIDAAMKEQIENILADDPFEDAIEIGEAEGGG